MLTERQFNTGTVVINYAESESPRPPLALLHGAGLWWKYFLPVLPRLSARWHTYALDLRGHGKSGRVPNGYQWTEYTHDCINFLKANVSEPAMLLGHSLGGMVAIQTAATNPSLVRALVLEDPPLSYRRRAAAQNEQDILWHRLAASDLPVRSIVGPLAKHRPEQDAARIRMRARMLSLLDPDSLAAKMDRSERDGYDLDALLAAITCPVLLLRADPALSPALEDEDESAVRAAIEDVTVVQFPGSGHPIAATQPDVYGRVVSDFLEALD